MTEWHLFSEKWLWAMFTSCNNRFEARLLINAWPQHIPCFWSCAFECKHTQHQRHPGCHRYNKRRCHSLHAYNGQHLAPTCQKNTLQLHCPVLYRIEASKCHTSQTIIITRNKSNASFEAVQYQQDVFPIAHYHNRRNFPTRCSENHNNTCAENRKIHGLKFDTQ